MRYKVTFKGENPYEYFDAHNSKYSVTIFLEGANNKQFEGVIFRNGETKVFTVYSRFTVCTETSNGKIEGDAFSADIEYAITVKNGEYDLQVKPFSYEITDLEWFVFDDASYDYDNCGVILNDTIIKFRDKLNFNANGLKQFLSKLIVVEEVED